MKYQKYFAEFLGTFALASTVGISIVVGGFLPTPIVAGLTLMIMVYVLGPVSGTHINPAVTIGLWSVKKIGWVDAIAYIIAQFLGAALAMYMVKEVGVGTNLLVENTVSIGLMEAIGAFFLVFGIGSVVFKSAHEAASGLVIGGSLILGIMMTAGLSNGVLNPAVALGIESVSVAYMLGPIVGGVIGAWVAKFVFAK